MRIRLMKIVPTGATTASNVAATGDVAPANARPRAKPATRPISTRVVRDMLILGKRSASPRAEDA